MFKSLTLKAALLPISYVILSCCETFLDCLYLLHSKCCKNFVTLDCTGNNDKEISLYVLSRDVFFFQIALIHGWLDPQIEPEGRRADSISIPIAHTRLNNPKM